MATTRMDPRGLGRWADRSNALESLFSVHDRAGERGHRFVCRLCDLDRTSRAARVMIRRRNHLKR